MDVLKKAFFILRFALVLVAVATTMAVSCPEPEPEPEPTPEVTTKSNERRKFESSFTEGLYLKGECVLAFNVADFQRAVNPAKRNYRIQSDDQTRYLNVSFNNYIPSLEDEEVGCEVHYKLEADESTMLVVRFAVVRVSDEYLWLWNEFQKVGAIVHKL